MPDIQTALSKVLNEWDESNNQPEKQVEQTQSKPYLFKTTNNVTRNTFNAVRDNPGLVRKVILAKLETEGHKLASTTSILSQMIKQRLIREEENGTLYANFKEYVPLKGTSKPKVKVKVKAVKAVKAAPIEAAPQPQAMGITKAQSAWTNTRRVVDIDEWLSEVPLMQARMVYMRLKEIFEGETK
jgi:hypothetical protein